VKEKLPLKPYSALPEPYALVSLIVWISLVVVVLPDVASLPALAWRALLFGVLLSGAASHSWFVARTGLWLREPAAAATTVAWLLVVGVASAFTGSTTGTPFVGLLTFLQIALCSLIVNQVALRLTLLTAFVTTLSRSGELQLVTAGVAWLAFAVLAMFLLAYDRTAVKAGPGGYDRREPRYTGIRVRHVSLVALAASAVFLVTPLVSSIDLGLGDAFWPENIPLTGREAEAEGLGYGLSQSTSASVVADSKVEIMRLHTTPRVAGPLYVRGRTFDTFDGETWSDRSPAGNPQPISDGRADLGWTLTAELPKQAAPNLIQQYELLVQIEDGVVFSVGRPQTVMFGDRRDDLIRVSPNAVMLVQKALRRNTWYRVDAIQDVFSENQLTQVRDDSLQARAARNQLGVTRRDLEVPLEIARPVSERARIVTAGLPSAYEKALALETHLRSKYTYDLEHTVKGPQVVTDFLFREGRGHCALFASSMVMMLRTLGIPARYVTGFLARNPTFNGFVIRGSDGHAWVEAYVDGVGWVAFDPTAPAGTGSGIARQASGPGVRPEMEQNAAPGANLAGLYGRRDFGRSVPPAGGRGRAEGRRGGPAEEPGGATGAGGRGGPGGQVAQARDATERAEGFGGRDASGEGGGQAGGTAGTGESGRADGRAADGALPGSFLSPGGDTRLPGGDRGADARGGAAGTTARDGARGGGAGEARDRAGDPAGQEARQEQKAAAPPEPETVESAWRWLLALLAVIGVTGLITILAWNRGVEPVLERQRIQSAMPPSAEEDEPDPRRLIVKLYHAMVSGLGRLGLTRQVGDTPTEYAASVGRREPRLRAPVEELTELFQAARYGNQPVTPQQAARARGAWKRIASRARRPEPDFAPETEG
jgi:transglutaminase-like putative cysteine protease